MNVLLQDIFNFDEFTEQFTEEEQKKLMKLLPQIDSVNLADRFELHVFFFFLIKENIEIRHKKDSYFFYFPFL